MGMRDTTSKLAWHEKLMGELFVAAAALPFESRRILAIQAALESGFGTSFASKANNLWNLTAGPDGSPALKKWLEVGGRILPQDNADWEYADNGVTPQGREWSLDNGRWRRRISQNWRSYPTRFDCIHDYLGPWWLRRPNYTRVLNALIAGNMAHFVAELSLVRFYTLPPQRYLERMRETEAEVTPS